MATTTGTRAATPDAVTSPIAAEMLAAALDDYADTLVPTSRQVAGQQRVLRRTAKQFRDLHELDPLTVEHAAEQHAHESGVGG